MASSFIVGKYSDRDEAWAHVLTAEAGTLSMQQSFAGDWVVIDVKKRNAVVKEMNK